MKYNFSLAKHVINPLEIWESVGEIQEKRLSEHAFW